jgi:hypothetical protein
MTGTAGIIDAGGKLPLEYETSGKSAHGVNDTGAK